MAAVKIVKFLGEAPKISSELLPDAAAQLAFNVKLYSGDLIPYRIPQFVTNIGRTGDIKTLYALRNPADPTDLKWLSWINDVDIVVASDTTDEEQRFYYTGDGVPKVTTYSLATATGAPYPNNFYNLGLPLPETVLNTSATTFTTKNVSTFARDTGNIATIVTSAAHDLRTGNIVSITGFTFRSGTYSQSGTTITVTISNHGLSNGASVTLDFTSGTAVDGTFTISNVGTNTFDITSTTSASTSGNVNWSLTQFNSTNVEVTVVNSTTFTYFSPGPQVATTSYADGRVSLAGNTQARSYVYTWYTPWDEESIASEPSDNLYIKEGQIVTVTNLPTTWPSGDNFIRGIRLYRTLPSTSGTEYFRLKTLWFPIPTAKVSRSGNVSRVTMQRHHNLVLDDRFKLSGLTNSSFNITDGIVTDVIDDFTFEYAQTGSDVAETADTAGTLFHDAAENPDKTARYWGDGSYSFTDDFDSTILFNTLQTDDYDAPPEDLKGLTAVQNNILIGFVGNKLYFSEPGIPHAWPQKYALTFEYDIVGVAAVGGYILVMTNEYPYQVSGNNPATMSFARIDALLPCVSKRSIVNMGYGVAYATYGGIALYNPSAGMDVMTKLVHDWDTWEAALDPSTIAAKFYNGKYFASHGTNSFIFERDDRIGGFFVQINYTWLAAWYDPQTNNYYYVSDTNGNLYKWDPETQPLAAMEWKSKTIVTKDFLNLGAARIVADYTTPDAEQQAIIDYNNGVPVFNAGVWADYNPTVATLSYARASGVATIVTATPHGFTTGDEASISGFTSPTGATFNASLVEITVVDSTTFTYANAGGDVATTSDGTGIASVLKGLGDMNGPYDRLDEFGNRITNFGTLNSTVINGDNFTRSLRPTETVLPITFKLWVNKELVFQATVSSSDVFRLPTGYRSDTFEVGVSGQARVRAIHIGETPFGLRTA